MIFEKTIWILLEFFFARFEKIILWHAFEFTIIKVQTETTISTILLVNVNMIKFSEKKITF